MVSSFLAGGVLAGAPLTYLISDFGWQGVFTVLAAVSVAVTVLLFAVALRSSHKKED